MDTITFAYEYVYLRKNRRVLQLFADDSHMSRKFLIYCEKDQSVGQYIDVSMYLIFCMFFSLYFAINIWV